MPGHKHRVSLGGHTHSVTIPNHTHDLTYGIVRGKETPKAAVLLINGEERLSIGTDFEGDITAYLAGEDGKIPRGRYIRIWRLTFPLRRRQSALFNPKREGNTDGRTFDDVSAPE